MRLVAIFYHFRDTFESFDRRFCRVDFATGTFSRKVWPWLSSQEYLHYLGTPFPNRAHNYFARNEESSLGLHITTEALYIGTERTL